MKKKQFIALLAAFTAVSAMAFTGCNSCDDNKNPVVPPDEVPEPEAPSDKINIGVTVAEVTLKDYETADFNFAKYFRIVDDGVPVPPHAYVDASAVRAEAGEYEVRCVYKEKTASIKVTVIASVCTVTLSKPSVSLNTTALKDYDFKSLFTATVDGKSVRITDAMITTDLKAEAGEYTYTVTCGSASETLIITVIDAFQIEILNSYSEYELTKAELSDFDYKQLFSIYVGGIAEEVKDEYIDISALDGAEEGNAYPVTINFEKNGRTAQSTVNLKIVAKTQLSVTAKTVVTYPNSEDIDLKTLFEVKRGNQILTVTDDMISGTVDYSKEGDNEITLNYGGRVATAIVKVKLGVIINYAAADTVLIQKGTDISGYDFGADFSVVINGVKFTALDKSYFDLTDVDFAKTGGYKAKIRIPYNTKPLSLTGVQFDYFEKEITYEVVEKKVDYSIKVLEETVMLPSGTTKYNVFKNVDVVIDGVKRTLYDNPDYIGATTCYAEIKSEPLDFDSPAEQYVEIDVFVYGIGTTPVTVGFTVRIDNGVEVNGSERVIFSGTTVYPRELFTITEKGEPVAVTNEMVTGKIDLFNAGIYFVTAEYKGVSAQSKVVVLDREMTGTYKTSLMPIEKYEESDDGDYEYGWGDGGAGEYSLISPYSASVYADAAALNDFVVDEDGNMYFDDVKADMLSIIDDCTFKISIRTYEFVMRYADGIISLDPVNSVKLSYHDGSRPFVFFNENKWSTGSYVQINSSINGYHVLQRNSAGNLIVSPGAYSLDLIQITDKADGSSLWYGIKTQFINKYSADTFYAEEIFDYAVFAPDFTQNTGIVSSVQFGGETYSFTMSNDYKGIINKEGTVASPYAGMTFKGFIDGKEASFAVSAADRVTLKIDGKTVFDIIKSEQSTLKNGGADYAENTWLVYNKFYDGENTPMSYLFRLDKDNKTFTVDEKDDLFGRYVYGNTAFFFDGYGTGEMWFDTESKYMTTAFSYVKNGNNVTITYINPEPTFTHGKTAKLMFSDYKNVLTLREMTDAENLVGKSFVNVLIEDGAIVSVNNFVLGKGSGKKELFEGLSIVTKDGALSQTQMESKIEGFDVRYVDTSKIQFARAGFYQLIINIPVGGAIKSSYYAVQILDSVYSGEKLVGNYTTGAINSGSSLRLDEYGRIYGVFQGISFNGNAVLSGNTFTASAQTERGAITLTGEYVADGIIKATARGSVTFTDYFTTGSAKACGTEGFTLRAITAGGITVYAVASAPTALGETASVTALTGDVNTLGSILEVVYGEKTAVVKVKEWSGASSGLILSDRARGTYSGADGEILVLDGFGTAVLGLKTGSYEFYSNSVTVLFGTETKVYDLDFAEKTFKESGIALDESLLAGKSFEATFTFVCDYEDYPYRAKTVFEFSENGKVIIKSSSAEHDEECKDKYNPEYATGEGTAGTFTVAGNKITVTVNGKQIEFTFTDAVGLSAITCSKTGISASSHGYFAAGTVFGSV